MRAVEHLQLQLQHRKTKKMPKRGGWDCVHFVQELREHGFMGQLFSDAASETQNATEIAF